MPIATAHPYSARKFTCHVTHRARALSTKMNNDRADGHCYSFAWINDLGCSVTPTFLFRNRFYLQLSPHRPKMKKKSSQLVTDVIRLSYFPDQSCNSRGMLLVIVRSMNILKTLSFSSLQESGTKFILQIGTLNPHGINERVSFNSIYSYFSRCHVTTNSVAPTLL